MTEGPKTGTTGSHMPHDPAMVPPAHRLDYPTGLTRPALAPKTTTIDVRFTVTTCGTPTAVLASQFLSFPKKAIQWERLELKQVGWYGPYGIIPGGMDNEPVPTWQPLYVVVTNGE